MTRDGVSILVCEFTVESTQHEETQRYVDDLRALAARLRTRDHPNVAVSVSLEDISDDLSPKRRAGGSREPGGERK